MNIINSNNGFSTSNITISQPNGMQGGSYFCNIKYNGDDFLIETPKCSMKTIKINKGYIDVLFDDENNYVLNIINQIETNIKS